MSNFMNVTLVGEEGDVPCTPKRDNTVIKTKYNGFKTATDVSWDDWEFALVFPDNEKAQYFVEHFESSMEEFNDGMIEGDYVYHVIHFKYPKVKELYADQIMR